jgi:dihydrolipoamide dehydrogenase
LSNDKRFCRIFDTSGEGVKANVKTANGNVTLEADIVLSAVGIAANIENIGLEEVGIQTDKGRVLVNEWYQTSVPGYYAIGDIIPTQALLTLLLQKELLV